MVKILKINIKNFKFYFDEFIDIDSKNYLIYGENGVGKSSLFQSLYYLFYSYFNNSLIENIEESKNRNSSDEIELSIEFSNNESITIGNNYIDSNVSILKKQNIYLLDYKFLDKVVDERDFFITLNNIKDKFLIFNDLFNTISDINNNIDNLEPQEIIDKRVVLDKEIVVLLDTLKEYTNKIIEELKENFLIEFEFENSDFEDTGTTIKLNNPKIYIKLDGCNDFKPNFNESKIKILSLALVFAIIKLNQEENISNNSYDLKLLVLDDFLSSLDMGNRLYIMEYIFNNFEGFQKIILTHNSLFFNIIKRLIHVHGKFNIWSYKNIYQSLRDDGFYEPKVLVEKDYLADAKDKYNNLEYKECGNLLRKEIEKIIAQSAFLFKTGKKETLEDAITHIRKRKKYYINSNNILEDINIYYEKFKTKQFLNQHISSDKKLEIMVQKLNTCFDSININSEKLNEILENINFYQTILNQASHYESDTECYKIEYQEAIKDVQNLKDIFDDFIKIQNQQ